VSVYEVVSREPIAHWFGIWANGRWAYEVYAPSISFMALLWRCSVPQGAGAVITKVRYV
jgi:hypothetical protein